MMRPKREKFPASPPVTPSTAGRPDRGAICHAGKARRARATLIWRQVGRPWLHWSLRSVTSIWRSSAFISSSVRRRFARTAPWQAMVASNSLLGALDHAAALVLCQLGQHVARELHRVALGQRAGDGAHGQRLGGKRRDFQPKGGQCLAGIFGGGHLGRRGGKRGGNQERLAGDLPGVELLLEPLVDDAFVGGVHVDHHQALRVFGQDVDALELRDRAAQRPVASGQWRGRCAARRWAGHLDPPLAPVSCSTTTPEHRSPGGPPHQGAARPAASVDPSRPERLRRPRRSQLAGSTTRPASGPPRWSAAPPAQTRPRGARPGAPRGRHETAPRSWSDAR